MSLAGYAKSDVAAGQTDASLVSAVTGKRILVMGVALQCGATGTTATFNSKGSGSGTAISMQFQNASNGGAVLPISEFGWMITNSGEALTVTTGAGATTGIQIVYITV